MKNPYLIKYKSSHCSLIVEMFSKGATLSAFCCEVGVGRHTIYDWIDKYPDFKAAYRFAREKAKHFRDCRVEANLERSNEPGMPTFELANYLQFTKKRFQDLEHERERVNLFDEDSENLFLATKKLLDLAANEKVPSDVARQLTAILTAAVNVKDSENFEQRLKALEDTDDDEAS